MNKYSHIINSEKFAVFILLLVTLFWGLTFPIIKVSLNYVSSQLFVALRFTMALILFLPFVWKQLKTADRKTYYAGLILGVIVFLGYNTQTIGLKYTTATKSAFITGLVVIMIPVFHLVVTRKLPSPFVLLGVLLALPGIIFLTTNATEFGTLLDELGSGFNIGDFITVICALLYAVYVLYLDNVSKKHSTRMLVFMQIAVSAVAGFIAAFVFDATNIEKMKLVYDESLLIGLGYTGLVVTVFATTIQTKFQKFVTPSEAGIIYSFEPVFAAIFAFFLLNEKFTMFGLLGAALIFAGLFVTQVFERKNGKV